MVIHFDQPAIISLVQNFIDSRSVSEHIDFISEFKKI